MTSALLALPVDAQVRHEIKVPDIADCQTLKCDFHMHTVFSDGSVWPTVRVDEAYREGLDAIALTEHLEYRPHSKDIQAHHGRSWEIAEKSAQTNGILLIRGSEITRSMAPGHFNAIFYKTAIHWNRKTGTILLNKPKNKMPLFSGIIQDGSANNPIRLCGGMSILKFITKAGCRVLKLPTEQPIFPKLTAGVWKRNLLC